MGPLFRLIDAVVERIDGVAELTRVACSAWVMGRGISYSYSTAERGESRE